MSLLYKLLVHEADLRPYLSVFTAQAVTGPQPSQSTLPTESMMLPIAFSSHVKPTYASASGGQKRASNPMEQELQVLVRLCGGCELSQLLFESRQWS